MGITEQANDLRVVAPKMLCDTSLGDDIPPPCLRGHFFWGVFGSAGRGKSSYLISLLSAKGANRVYRKVFHNIWFVVPEHSMASVGHSIFRDHDPEKLFHELIVKNLETIKALVEREALEGYNSLLVIDDQTAYFKDRGVERLLRYLIFNRRHLRLSVFLLAQSYNQLPLSIRKTLSTSPCLHLRTERRRSRSSRSSFSCPRMQPTSSFAMSFGTSMTRSLATR